MSDNNYRTDIEQYIPLSEAEETDKKNMLEFIEHNENVFASGKWNCSHDCIFLDYQSGCHKGVDDLSQYLWCLVMDGWTCGWRF